MLRRLDKVIDGEQSGVSKRNNWQGEGSFVYCELAKLNQNYVDAIEKATTNEELTKLYADILETGFISYKVNPMDIDTNSEEFIKLSIDDKKKLLMELLDKNQLYVNYCDIDDETYGISEEDKAFTKSFYEEV
jgi:adenine-specific DNA-methyltransferase